MADLFKLLQPLQFIQSFLKKGSRTDGRKFDQFRNLVITGDCISTANGSALVKLGTSSAMCGIKTSLVKPQLNEPEKGVLDLNVIFSNVCSTDLDNPDRTAVADLVRECLKKVFFHSNMIDLSNLCLIARKYVWKIELEIICLNMNGSIVDLSLMAATSALKFCKLQKYDVDHDFGIIKPTDSYYSLPLNKSIPVFLTFCLINDNLLVDPIGLEEELSESLIRIAIESCSLDKNSNELNSSDIIYFLEVTGSKDIEQSVLKKLFHYAIDRSITIRSILNQAM